MTTTAPRRTTLEIAAFVDEVRTQLANLHPAERDELLDGLEADLTEQQADGAVRTDLGDPRAYAVELRLAAGLPEPTRRLPRLPRRARLQVPRMDSVERLLDCSHVLFRGAVDAQAWRRATWEVVTELRSAWWVARAWLLVTLLDVVAGHSEPVSVIPSLGHPLVGPAVFAVAVLVSVLVGLGRLWPGSGADRPVASRVALLVVNIVAVVTPLTFSIPNPGYINDNDPYADGSDPYSAGYRDAQLEGQAEARQPGLHVGAKEVTNVFVYGPGGQPLAGVQLFDQDGEPISVPSTSSTGRGLDRQVPCPSYNGTTPLFNVFPLDQVQLRRDYCTPETMGRNAPTLPLAEVPPLN